MPPTECSCGSNLPATQPFPDATPMCAVCREAVREAVVALLRELTAAPLQAVA